MNDLGFHLVLFLVVGSVIVAISAFYTEREDARALAIVPRRLAFFLAGCALVALLMLVLEHTVASVK